MSFRAKAANRSLAELALWGRNMLNMIMNAWRNLCRYMDGDAFEHRARGKMTSTRGAEAEPAKGQAAECPLLTQI